jgi:tetratricopeptide (TPR) repeat protein
VLLGPSILVSALLLPAPLPASSLAAAAAASGRPKECSSRARRALARGPSVWELARVPNLQRYCDLMARAQAELGTMPAEAKKAAEEADQALPGRAPPSVAVARAALALGAVDEAARAFERARSIDPRSVEDPATLHDLGRTLARSGKRDEALVVYRALVPRVDLLGSTDRKVAVLLEAAHVSMAASAAGAVPSPADLVKGKAPPRASRLDEAIAYLREARQHPPTQLAADVMLSLALALDRAGDRDEADATLVEARAKGARLGPALDYLAVPEDRAALDALAAEGSDRVAAQKAWEGYLAGKGGKGPWAAEARARLDALKKGPQRSAKAKGGKAQ